MRADFKGWAWYLSLACSRLSSISLITSSVGLFPDRLSWRVAGFLTKGIGLIVGGMSTAFDGISEMP